MAYGDNRGTPVGSDTFDSTIDTGNWENGPSTYGSFSWVTGGYVEPASADDCMLRNKQGTYGDDQWSEATIQTFSGPACYPLSSCRTPSGSTVAYAGGLENSGVDTYLVYRIDASESFTLIDSTSWGAAPLVTGDTVTLEVEGSSPTTLRVGTNEGSGDSQKLTNNTDSSGPQSGGTPGMQYYENSTSSLQVTSWQGGTIGAAPAGANPKGPFGGVVFHGPFGGPV